MIVDLAWLRTFLAYPSLTALARDEKVMATARTLVLYYYLLIPYAALLFLQGNLVDKPNFDPFWPIAWVGWLQLSTPAVILAIKLYFIGASLLGLLLYRFRAVRILVFIAIWQVHAIESSFGYMNHQWYEWLYSSFIFIFLPDIWNRSTHERDRLFLLLIWFAQAFVALTYTMAGVNKVGASIEQYMLGLIHSFSVMGLAYTIADWLPKLQAQAPLAAYMIEHPYVSCFLYVSIQIIQVFSLWVMVRTSLQRIWGAVIILFHIGTALIMGISFHPLLILVALLFLNSPFARPYGSVTAFLRDLPIIGQLMDAYAGLQSRSQTRRSRMSRRRRA